MIFNTGGRIPSGVELLWTNESPNEDFVNKTFPREFLEYKILYIVYKQSTTSTMANVKMINAAVVLNDHLSQRITIDDGINRTYRDITFLNNSLHISDGVNRFADDSVSTVYDRLIPLYIYGTHKFV